MKNKFKKIFSIFVLALTPLLTVTPFFLSGCSNNAQNLYFKDKLDLLDVSLYYNFDASTSAPINWIKYDESNDLYYYNNQWNSIPNSNETRGNTISLKDTNELDIITNPTIANGNDFITAQFLVQLKDDSYESVLKNYNSFMDMRCYTQSGIYNDITPLADYWWRHCFVEYKPLLNNEEKNYINFYNNNFYFFEKYIDKTNKQYDNVLLLNSCWCLGKWNQYCTRETLFGETFFDKEEHLIKNKFFFAFERENPQSNVLSIDFGGYQIIWPNDIQNIVKFNKVIK